MLLTVVGIRKSKERKKERKAGCLQNAAQTTVITECGGGGGLRTIWLAFICFCPSLKPAEERLTEALQVRVQWNKPTHRRRGSSLLITRVKSGSLALPSGGRDGAEGRWSEPFRRLRLIHRGAFHAVGILELPASQ